MKASIETYRAEDKGYHPFLIREGWQVAQLNYISQQDAQNLDKVEVHHQTDEVFVLLTGAAVLIAANLQQDHIEYNMQRMEQGVTYNIPKDIWHNIAMEHDSEVLIVEKSDTHLSDVEYFYLSEMQKLELEKAVKQAFQGLQH